MEEVTKTHVPVTINFQHTLTWVFFTGTVKRHLFVL